MLLVCLANPIDAHLNCDLEIFGDQVNNCNRVHYPAEKVTAGEGILFQ